ncbi:MAG: hypothetical protein JWL62_2327 [Hyphomicrobiales bacterium]|nr:hypothetical protein [Hyphomicrobiales bacterium]
MRREKDTRLTPREGALIATCASATVSGVDGRYPNYLVVTPRHGDMVPLAAGIMAIAMIKQSGGKIGDALRSHARSWVSAFAKLSPELQS